MKKNPFHKYLKQEDHLQIQLAQWLSHQYPNLLWIHVPNEGRRSPFEQYLFSLLGTAKGASDMIFFEPRGKYHGLMIELKVIYANGKKNYPSEAQKQFIKNCQLRGYYATVVWTFDQAVDIIVEYISQGK